MNLPLPLDNFKNVNYFNNQMAVNPYNNKNKTGLLMNCREGSFIQTLKADRECNNHCDLHCMFTVTNSIKKILDNLNVKDKAIKHETFQENEIIFRENESNDYIISIRSGLIKLANTTIEGNQRIFCLAGPGYAIGLSSLINEPPRHNAIALQSTKVCKIPISLLKKLYIECPELYQQLMHFWQLNLDMADQFILNFSTGVISSRLANLILFLIHIDSSVNESINKINKIKLLHLDDMAAVLGVSPETVCRELSKLKRNKCLTKIKRQEYFFDYKGIIEMVHHS